MPALAASFANPPDPRGVTVMLAAVPERGSYARLVQSGSVVLGVAADDRLPDEGTIHQDGQWAAVAVGTVDDLKASDAASPAQAALEMIRSDGPEALNHLRGSFAAVVTDGCRVWAARDHVGTEPLYHHQSRGRLSVVSEPKQLAPVLRGGLEADLQVVEAIFYGEDYDLRRTVYRDVHRVEMASYLEWSGTSSRVSRYWRPEGLFETARLSPDEIAERFDELMCRAVRRTLRGRDAVLLSGGIDSATVAAYAARSRRPSFERPLGAVSAVYPNHPSVDERELIELLAARYGLELHTFTPGTLKLDRLGEWVRTFDGPWAAWHPGWTEETYRFAAARGYRVLLSGFFAENVVALTRGLVPHLVASGRVRHALAYLADQRARGVPRASGLRTVAAAFAPRWVMSLRRRRHPQAVIPTWMDPRRVGVREGARALAPRALWKAAQLGFIGGPHPAMEAYAKLQARCGVRVRHPWSDVDLWEFFISLPAQVKHPDSRPKALLRNVLRGRVPDAILDRPKMVFNDYITDRIDYPSLRRWLTDPPLRLGGIDYTMLAGRLAAEDLPMSEFISAKDLATAHAFLAGGNGA